MGDAQIGITMSHTSKRKEAEDALNRELHLLEALLENSEDFIYFKDRESRMLNAAGRSGERSPFGADGHHRQDRL